VYSTPRELAKHAVIDPFVDFTSLDVVGVVVPRKTQGDRLVINGLGQKSGQKSAQKPAHAKEGKR
jgi:rod shape-determining protein MreC